MKLVVTMIKILKMYMKYSSSTIHREDIKLTCYDNRISCLELFTGDYDCRVEDRVDDGGGAVRYYRKVM